MKRSIPPILAVAALTAYSIPPLLFLMLYMGWIEKFPVINDYFAPIILCTMGIGLVCTIAAFLLQKHQNHSHKNAANKTTALVKISLAAYTLPVILLIIALISQTEIFSGYSTFKTVFWAASLIGLGTGIISSIAAALTYLVSRFTQKGSQNKPV